MFLILTWDEEDSQSSKKCWSVWYPYRRHGFETRELAEKQILKEGERGRKFFISEVMSPVTPSRVLAFATGGD